MHVQIRPYRRAHPQRIADLAALVRYLLEAKDTESDQNHLLRLAGPPVTSRVVQRLSPFGGTVREAAYDLAQQVFNHARESQIAGNLPSEIYKHLVLSFPVHQPLNRKFKELTQRSADWRVASDFQIIVRVVRELLDSMGIGDVPPLIIVVHNDTKHFHAHVVVGLYANDLDCSGVIRELKPSLIKKIASTLYAAHSWPFPSEALASEYGAIINSKLEGGD